jgi:hypothetical protein
LNSNKTDVNAVSSLSVLKPIGVVASETLNVNTACRSADTEDFNPLPPQPSVDPVVHTTPPPPPPLQLRLPGVSTTPLSGAESLERNNGITDTNTDRDQAEDDVSAGGTVSEKSNIGQKDQASMKELKTTESSIRTIVDDDDDSAVRRDDGEGIPEERIQTGDGLKKTESESLTVELVRDSRKESANRDDEDNLETEIVQHEQRRDVTIQNGRSCTTADGKSQIKDALQSDTPLTSTHSRPISANRQGHYKNSRGGRLLTDNCHSEENLQSASRIIIGGDEGQGHIPRRHSLPAGVGRGNGVVDDGEDEGEESAVKESLASAKRRKQKLCWKDELNSEKESTSSKDSLAGISSRRASSSGADRELTKKSTDKNRATLKEGFTQEESADSQGRELKEKPQRPTSDLEKGTSLTSTRTVHSVPALTPKSSSANKTPSSATRRKKLAPVNSPRQSPTGGRGGAAPSKAIRPSSSPTGSKNKLPTICGERRSVCNVRPSSSPVDSGQVLHRVLTAAEERSGKLIGRGGERGRERGGICEGERTGGRGAEERKEGRYRPRSSSSPIPPSASLRGAPVGGRLRPSSSPGRRRQR